MQNEKEQNEVCVLGLGYVGLTLATIYAEEGSKVSGVDTNAAVIDQLEAGIPHFYEPGLPEKMAAYSERLSFSTTIPKFAHPVVYVIAVGSNLGVDGTPDYSHVESVSESIAKNLKKGDLVILRSTVTIGTTRERVIPILERGSNLQSGKDFYVAFAPERTIEGKALEELRTLPQIVAGYTRACRDHAEQFFSRVSRHIVLFDTLEEAELSKLISNSYRDLSFAFANSIALIASVHNINISTVIAGANDGYARNNIPLPSPGVGGYCLSKDPQLLGYGLKEYQEAAELLLGGRRVNDAMPAHVARVVQEFSQLNYEKDEPHIIIAGLAFKGSPATSDVRNSPSEFVINELRKCGYSKISGYDPHVSPDVFDDWQIGRVESLADIIKNGDIVILMHKNTHYTNFDFAAASKDERKKLLFDPWGMHNHNREMIVEQGGAYANLGFRSFAKYNVK